MSCASCAKGGACSGARDAYGAVPRGAPTSDEYGSPTSFSGPRQIFRPKPILIAFFDGASATGPFTRRFRVPTPDSRTRVNVALIGVPDPGGSATFLTGKTVTLQLQSVSDAQQGGMSVPVTSLPDPAVSAAFAIPQNATLGGFAYEAVTIGDAIEGVLTITGNVDGIKGQLVLQTRIQPDGQRLPWEEWREIVSQFNPVLFGSRVVTG